MVARNDKQPDPARMLSHPTAVDEALREGVRRALLMHKRLGHSVVVWRDGKVVWLKPEEIEVDENGNGDRANPTA